MGFMAPSQQNIAPPIAPTQAQPVQQPASTKPGKKPMTPTFLGADSVPNAGMNNMGGKTLLGQ